MITNNTDNGTIIYTENALANIVGIKVLETAGVQGLVAKNPADGLWKALQKDNYAKGIVITNEKDEDALSISIAISVAYGVKFSEVAKNIITNVKFELESLTDLKVKNITVTIQEVRA